MEGDFKEEGYFSLLAWLWVLRSCVGCFSWLWVAVELSAVINIGFNKGIN